MGEVKFEFADGDAPSASTKLTAELAGIAARKADAIRRFGYMRREAPEEAAAGIEAANAWGDCAEELIVLSHDAARDAHKVGVLKAGGMPDDAALVKQLKGQIAVQAKRIDHLAKSEPELRDRMRELLSGGSES